MKSVCKFCLLFFILNTLAYASEIIMESGAAMIIHEKGKYYYFPESKHTMAEKTHHLYIEGTRRTCYPEINPDIKPNDLVIVHMRDDHDNRGIIRWYCYEE